MPRRTKIVKFHPQGHTVYIMEGADGSYYTGLCSSPDLKKELEKATGAEIKHFRKPGRLPVKIAFKEEHLHFKEAYLKFKYLRTMRRPSRKRLIETKKWPAGKMLEPLILEKMQKYLEE